MIARILLALAAAVALAQPAQAETIGWDYGSTTGIVGFKLYCGDASGNHGTTPVATVSAASKTASVALPAASTKYCVVTAYTAAKESAKSNELRVDVAPDAPTNLRLALSLTLDERGRIISAQVERIDNVLTAVRGQ